MSSGRTIDRNIARMQLRLQGEVMRPGRRKRIWCGCGLAAAVWFLSVAPPAHSQPAAAPPTGAPSTSSPDTDGGPDVKESSVGYIDSALPFSHLGLRFD